MTAIQSQPRLTFEQFLDYDDGTAYRYELFEGIPVEMPEPSDLHEDIVAALKKVFEAAIEQRSLNWQVRLGRLVQIPVGGFANGRRPDLAIVTQTPPQLKDQRRAIYNPPHMVVEIASSNWSDDLKKKVRDYALLQVPEYWVVDYRGQIPEKDCERGKGIKTIVFRLDGYQYKRQEYLGDEAIECAALRGLTLTTNTIVAA